MYLASFSFEFSNSMPPLSSIFSRGNLSRPVSSIGNISGTNKAVSSALGATTAKASSSVFHDAYAARKGSTSIFHPDGYGQAGVTSIAHVGESQYGVADSADDLHREHVRDDMRQRHIRKLIRERQRQEQIAQDEAKKKKGI